MKKFFNITIISVSLIFTGCETLNQYATDAVQQAQNGNPTKLEMNQGIKQALEFGTSYSTERLSAKDGFLGNIAVKILFPQEAKKVENTLRSIGLNQLCDNVIVSLNRAAEDAAQKAKPIFVAAIKEMTFADVTNIVLGKQDAATIYFKRTTTSQLTQQFSPVIQTSLNSVGATRYWTDVTARYNKIPLVKPINTDLAAYVTEKAIDGLFIEIAKEELKIRNNLAARSTGLLKKVFAYADRNRI